MFKINNLTYQYDKTRKALDNVSMDFNKGDIIGIIGSNGSGKSTLFNNLMGILKSTEGEILYNGEQIKYDKKSLYNLRKEVGIVFQDPEKQIFYSMVYDDIAFALRNIGMDEKTIKDRIHTALEAVNGLQFIDRPVHNLSFGQKKRVAIASVVAMENKLVLLDEPTAGLDPISTRAIVDIIKGLNDRGVKIIISSHDMNLIYAGSRQTEWDKIAEENDFIELVKQAITETLYIGDGAFKISFDTNLSKYPILEFYSGDKTEIIKDREELRR